MADPDAEAWRIVRSVRNEFVGRRRAPSDEDWAEFIASGIARLAAAKTVSAVKTDDYEDGYQDACDDIESAALQEKSRRRAERRRLSRPVALARLA